MKTKVSIFERATKECPEFVDEVAGLSVDQIETRLAQLAEAVEELADKREADEELAEAQERAKELGKAYSEPTKAIKLKSRYLVALRKEKGAQ